MERETRLTPTGEGSPQIVLQIVSGNHAVGDVSGMRAVGPVDGERLNPKSHLGLPDLVQDPHQRPPDHEAEDPTDELVVKEKSKTVVDAADLRERQRRQRISVLEKKQK